MKKRLRELQELLQTHKDTLFQNQHRDGKKKTHFKLAGSFKVGVGSTKNEHMGWVKKGKIHFVKHPFKNAGVWIKPVEQQLLDKQITSEQLTAYKLARKIFRKVDRDFTEGEFVIQFSRMDDKDQYVKMHRDSNDISPQYALALGDFEGANLKCYDSIGGAKIVNYRNKIVKMDGRLPHEVVDMADFKGERFTIIAYKTYDHRKLTADPILETPEIVWNGM